MPIKIPIVLLALNFMLLHNSLAQDNKTLTAPVKVNTRNKEDTLKALEKLYHRIHRNNNRAMIISGAALIAAVTISASDEFRNNNLAVVTTGLAGITLVSVINSFRFNKKWYGQAVENYKAGKPLPRRLFYRLKERDFE